MLKAIRSGRLSAFRDFHRRYQNLTSFQSSVSNVVHFNLRVAVVMDGTIALKEPDQWRVELYRGRKDGGKTLIVMNLCDGKHTLNYDSRRGWILNSVFDLGKSVGVNRFFPALDQFSEECLSLEEKDGAIVLSADFI